MLKKSTFFLFFVLTNCFVFSQVSNFKEKFILPDEVKETSGLLFFNGKIITHNDSENAANLYELDSVNGNILRTITINNVTNTDWEDITQDENYIYIADIGNNNGNRTDLKILKILKSDYLNSDVINAEIIAFSYEDQTDFSNRPNANNFDAEALISVDDSLFIFTKNWVDYKTNVYKIPKTKGTYSAEKVSTANVEGAITGATFSNNSIMLCGSNVNFVPFLIFIPYNSSLSDNVFNDGFSKYNLTTEMDLFSQVEAITFFDDGKLYLSREKVNQFGINLSPKLYEFQDDRTKTLSTIKSNFIEFKIAPNPASEYISIQSNAQITSIEIFNTLGKKVFTTITQNNKIDISKYSKGIYIIKATFTNNKVLIKKVIKL